MNIPSIGTTSPSSSRGSVLCDQPSSKSFVLSVSSKSGKAQKTSLTSIIKNRTPLQQKFLPSKPTTSHPVTKPPLPETFQVRFQRECIEGSAIAANLFSVATTFVFDCVAGMDGDFESPLSEALGWEYRRFGHQARRASVAGIFLNEDDSVWQAKLDHPRTDKKGKVIKYETPVGNGSCPYLPPIDQKTRSAIARRYGVQVPPVSESFWGWVALHPEIPIVITEGAKKALALLSQGYVAIALYGVDGGARAKDSEGNRCKPYLIPELIPFATGGRRIIIAFDQDAEAKTRTRVNRAIIRLCFLLKKGGSQPLITSWNGALGKGVDDLIVNQGVLVWNEAYEAAIPLEEWLQAERLLKRLTYPPSMVLNVQDLSLLDLSNLPKEGIIAIASPKGTGKTKAIGELIRGEDKVLLATHRICLGRNLCQRIGVHWRGDLDKVGGNFITGAAYTLRVGLCVDSFLAIDPSKFAGCVLVVDEAVQAIRHMLTSTTCRQDGKLPALLAKLRRIIEVARLVILADADLDNKTLRYFQELRGDQQPIYLIRNDFQPKGYPCDFIVAPNDSPAIARLLQDVQDGQRVFVTTDSKAKSKQLSEQCYRIGLNREQVLLLNSETSGEPEEQAFITNPDLFLGNHPKIRVVIASPSLSTGASIESEFFDKVYGLFAGVSLTDGDMAQALMRVRRTIPRVVWCAKQGISFHSFSNSTRSGDILDTLKKRSDTQAMLLRSNLREDTYEAIANIEWQTDPHVKLFAEITAETNQSMWNLRANLKVRLRLEGHTLTVIDMESDRFIQEAMKASREKVASIEAEAIANAKILSRTERAALEAKESLTSEERLSLIKTALADFYCTEAITPELVMEDKSGLRRSRLLALEQQLHPELSQQRDIQTLERQMKWNRGLCPWDLSVSSTKQAARYSLGLDWYLNPDVTWTKYDNAKVAEKARHCSIQVKEFLGLGGLNKISDTQIVHQLLAQMGIQVQGSWSRRVPGYEGEKIWVYRIDREAWEADMAILERRAAQRAASEATVPATTMNGSPSPLIEEIQGDDPILQADSNWLTPESLDDVLSILESVKDDPIAFEEIKAMVPYYVLEHLGVR